MLRAARHGAVKHAMLCITTRSSLPSPLRSVATIAGESNPEVFGKKVGALKLPVPVPVSSARLN